jgi:glutaminyl-peptide cyclotransferase
MVDLQSTDFRNVTQSQQSVLFQIASISWQHIVDTLRGLQWTVDEAQFQDRTPIANDVTFTNIIATLDPLAPRRLVLACHYDSLKTNSGRFVGATDSAVPCAQLLNLAYVLRDALQAHREQVNGILGLQQHDCVG